MQECSRCGLKLTSSASPEPETRCPSCGEALASPQTLAPQGAVNGAWQILRNYFATVWEILTRPSHFFRRMPLTGGLGAPLAFALVTHWIGSALGFLWLALLGGRVAHFFAGLTQIAGDVAEVDSPGSAARWLEATDRVTEWVRNAGPVVADPFLTLFSVLFTSCLVYVGARIFITPSPNAPEEKNAAPRQVDFESAVRVVCYGMSPAILAGLPLFGFGLAEFLTLIITVIAAKEAYRTSTGRAIVIALFPKLLFLALLLGMVLIFVLIFAKLVISLI